MKVEPIFFKVQLFWEGHKNFAQSSSRIWHYLKLNYCTKVSFFWCSNPKNDFCYCPVISYYWWPSEYSKEVKMSNYWSLFTYSYRPMIWHFYFFTTLWRPPIIRNILTWVLELPKNRRKWIKKGSKNLWLMNRLYLLVAYPVLATQWFGLFQFILYLIFWDLFRPKTPELI